MENCHQNVSQYVSTPIMTQHFQYKFILFIDLCQWIPYQPRRIYNGKLKGKKRNSTWNFCMINFELSSICKIKTMRMQMNKNPNMDIIFIVNMKNKM